jgi:hypothetical protein
MLCERSSNAEIQGSNSVILILVFDYYTERVLLAAESTDK